MMKKVKAMTPVNKLTDGNMLTEGAIAPSASADGTQYNNERKCQ